MKNSKPTGSSSGPRRDPAFWLMVGLGLALVLGVTGFFTARPAYRWFKQHRAVGMLPEGELALKEQRLEDAGRVVKATLGLAPWSPDVLALAARYSSRLGLAQGLNYWSQVAGVRALTEEEQIERLQLALDLGRTDVAGQLLSGFTGDSVRQNPAVLRLAIRYQRALGNLPAAIQGTRQWLAGAPTDPEAEWLLASLLAQSAGAAERREGHRLLLSMLLRDGDPRQPQAAEALAEDGTLPPAEARVVLRQLPETADFAFARHLLRMRLEPERRADWIAELVATTKASGDLRLRLAAAAWLGENQALEQVLDVLPADVAEQQPLVMSGRLVALVELRRTEEVRRFLEGDVSKLEGYQLHCLRAYEARQASRPGELQGHFEKAVAAAADNPGRVRFVAQFAEAMGEPGQAVTAYRRLLAWTPGAAFAARRLLRLAEQMDNLQLTHETLQELARQLPGDRSVALAAAYTMGLLDRVTLQQRDSLLTRLGDEQNLPEAALVLALLDWRIGDAGAALRRLEAMDPGWLAAQPRRQALQVAILGANEQREAARRLARTVPLDRLRSEERALVDPWLR